MDVRKGNCWRCEGPGTAITCQKCGKPSYCSNKCCVEDKARHQAQCEMWSPKTCSNQGCSGTKNLKECSSCHHANYCSVSCQSQHWKNHKTSCRERVKGIKEAQKFSIHIKIEQRALGVPYYIGNDLATDLLNLQGNEMMESNHADVLNQDYSILSAGCGNIRHLIYTVTSLPKEFTGKLRVTLNDIDPFIHARNLLFLFMMVHFSSNPDIGCLITTIWYSLHLRENEHKILIDSLRILSNIEHEKLMEMTKGVIDIKDSALTLLQQVWEGWLKVDQQEQSWRKASLSQQRDKMFKEDPNSADGLVSYKATIQKRHRDSAESWVHNGDFLPSGKTAAKNQKENSTLTGRKDRGAGRVSLGFSVKSFKEQQMQANTQPKDTDFDFCVISDLMPFGEWDYLAASKYSNDKSLIVMTHAFVTNQIQQTISFINKKRLHINIDLGSCLEIAEEVQEKYDRIFTSNIADYVGHRMLLHAMKPLLSTTNKNAVLVTHCMNWCKFFPKSFADYPMYLVDRRWHMWVESAKEDTKKDLQNRPRHWYQEYFNNSSYFIDYLRADLMSSKIALDVDNAEDKVPSFVEVKQQCSGLRMRDFRYHLNKVAPWKYRQNARAVNMLSGTSRMLEWYISD